MRAIPRLSKKMMNIISVSSLFLIFNFSCFIENAKIYIFHLFKHSVNAKEILAGLLHERKEDAKLVEDPKEIATAQPLSEDEDDELNAYILERKAAAAREASSNAEEQVLN